MANDPRAFLAGVVELFEAYPAEVVDRVVSVVDGLPSRHKWSPRISEIKEALEEAMEPIHRAREYEARERRIEAQLAERDEVDNQPRPTYDELKAKHGPNWGLGARPPGALELPSPFTSASELQAQVGIAVWKSIPDAGVK